MFSYKSPLLLAAGESVKKHLINYFKIEKERVIVFNNFIDIEEKPENIKTRIIKEEFCISDDSYVIGYVGRFSIREKGIDILIEAFKEFNKANPNSYLIMVGEGEDINKINLQKNVKIVSAKKNIFDYYGIFNCLILPSRVDPFPLTVLEAGMMKIPFVGANVNGISEIINNNTDGLLFEKENVNMLTEKMEIFFNDKNFALKCAENLNKKVIEIYELKRDVNLLNNIYEKQ
jgi:glycosyltransferase involved in cell wall biosynthesis